MRRLETTSQQCSSLKSGNRVKTAGPASALKYQNPPHYNPVGPLWNIMPHCPSYQHLYAEEDIIQWINKPWPMVEGATFKKHILYIHTYWGTLILSVFDLQKAVHSSNSVVIITVKMATTEFLLHVVEEGTTHICKESCLTHLLLP